MLLALLVVLLVGLIWCFCKCLSDTKDTFCTDTDSPKLAPDVDKCAGLKHYLKKHTGGTDYRMLPHNPSYDETMKAAYYNYGRKCAGDKPWCQPAKKFSFDHSKLVRWPAAVEAIYRAHSFAQEQAAPDILKEQLNVAKESANEISMRLQNPSADQEKISLLIILVMESLGAAAQLATKPAVLSVISNAIETVSSVADGFMESVGEKETFVARCGKFAPQAPVPTYEGVKGGDSPCNCFNDPVNEAVMEMWYGEDAIDPGYCFTLEQYLDRKTIESHGKWLCSLGPWANCMGSRHNNLGGDEIVSPVSTIGKVTPHNVPRHGIMPSEQELDEFPEVAELRIVRPGQ